jgi:2-dehydropantoate 2-reductase
MTILVVGGGAVGSLLAWTLRSGGQDVAVVRRQHEGGPGPGVIDVTDPRDHGGPIEVTIVASPDQLPVDPEVIVFAVKMFDLAQAVESCAGWPAVPALTVQNGIGAEDLVAELRPQAALIAGSLTASVEPIGPGELHRLTRGGLGLAPVQGAAEPVMVELACAFRAGGLRVRTYPHATAMKWSKLLANLMANATAALLDLDAARIYRHKGLFRLERAQLREALAVMAGLGLRPIGLPGADVRLLAYALRLPPAIGRPVLAAVMAGARGGKDPSLRIHLRSGGGPSEVEWLNGAVNRAGRVAGVPTPVNRRLTELVTEVLQDPDRRAWFRLRPDRLLEAMDRGH